MPRMTFLDMLRAAERQNRSMLCVGLDPEPTKFPAGMKGDANKIYDFCARIVDATADLVSSFKQVAVDQTSSQRRRFDLAQVLGEAYRLHEAVDEGVVSRILGEYANPEELAYNRDGLPRLPLYEVRFRQLDVWPRYEGSPRDTVDVDVYENWLEPAGEER